MVARTLPGIGLVGFWGLGFDGWDTQNDANLLKLSVLVQGRILSAVATVPPTPTDGDVHLLTSAPHLNEIAVRDNGAWVYLSPSRGWSVFNYADGMKRLFDGTNWIFENPYHISGFFNATPASSDVLLRHVFTDSVIVPVNLAGSKVSTSVNPATVFPMNVTKNGASVGTITISVAGLVTLSSAALSFAAGDILEIVAPAIADTAIAKTAFTIKGAR
jgi:Protein of unknown function (DUF2793)